MREGRRFVLDKIAKQSKMYGPSFKRTIPRNVLFFLGDGMGISTVTAGRIYVGSLRNQSIAEMGPLSFDSFDFTSLIRVRLSYQDMPLIRRKTHQCHPF